MAEVPGWLGLATWPWWCSSCQRSTQRRRAFMKKLLTVLCSSPSCCEMVSCISFEGRLFSLKMAMSVRRCRSVKTKRCFLGVILRSLCCSCSLRLQAVGIRRMNKKDQGKGRRQRKKIISLVFALHTVMPYFRANSTDERLRRESKCSDSPVWLWINSDLRQIHSISPEVKNHPFKESRQSRPAVSTAAWSLETLLFDSILMQFGLTVGERVTGIQK